MPDTRSAGTLVLALGRDVGELNRMARRTTGHEALDAAGIAALEPELEGRFGRGLFFPGEAHLDPREALPALAARLEALGGRIALGEPGRPAGRFDRVVDARGIGAQAALPGLRGSARRDAAAARPRRRAAPAGAAAASAVPGLPGAARGQRVHAGGHHDRERGARAPPRLRSVMELLSAAFALHPGFAEAEILELAADLRPSFGDNMPRLDVDAEVVHVNGMFRHGYLLAPVLAMRLADALLGAG